MEQSHLRKIILLLSTVSLCLWAALACQQGSNTPAKIEALTIAGSASALPSVRLLAQAYEERNPQTKIQFLPAVHSAGGIMGAADGTFDIGVISRSLTLAEGKNRLLSYPFAKDLLVFATHSGCSVRDVSLSELLGIYSGKITNWKELGGHDQDIVVLDRPKHTSAKLALEKTVFGNGFEITANTISLERPDQMVESLQSFPGSIGYTSFSDCFIRQGSIAVLHLDGISPTLENLEQHKGKQTYRTYSLVIKNRPSGLAKRFIDFVYSSEAEEIIRSRALIPAQRKIVVAFVPAVNIVEQEARYLPLFRYLSEKMGIPFEVEYAASYSQVVQDFSNNRLDAAFLGSFAYALVNSRVPLDILGRPEIGGQSFYTGILFVRKDSGIRQLSDLENKTFCFVDKATTAGYLFPLIYLKNHGVPRPEDFFREIFFSGSHDGSILSVLNGNADAGVAKDLVLMKAGEKNPSIALDLLMMATSPPVPTNGLCVRKNLDWDIKEDLEKILLNMDRDPDAQKVLSHIGASRFLPTTDSDYQNLYKMIKTLNIDLRTFDMTGPNPQGDDT
jgi:phosphate/phosphite/phosphonate ABC transporter binding protein